MLEQQQSDSKKITENEGRERILKQAIEKKENEG